MCVCVCQGITRFTRSSRLDLYGHTGVLGSGRSPFQQAFNAGQGCIPVLRLDQCDMHLGQNLARCVCVCALPIAPPMEVLFIAITSRRWQFFDSMCVCVCVCE